MFSTQVDALKAKLAEQEIVLKQKNDAADALIEIVGIETEKVSQEKTLGARFIIIYGIC
jgi:dynein heavy chain, axonemal